MILQKPRPARSSSRSAKGRTTLAEVSPNGALLKERAAVAVNAAPGAALVMGVDNADMARLVTGQVGQMLAADPTTPVLPAPVIPLASSRRRMFSA